MSFPPSSSLTATQSSYITAWIAVRPSSPAAHAHLEHTGPLKRKRASSAHMATQRRDPSPGMRQRVGDDMPGQCASVPGSSHPLDLGQHNTFSLPGRQVGSRRCSRASTGTSSPRRGNSPSRETIAMLKDARPSILTEPVSTTKG
jgi:hypothetical protein